MAVKLRERRPGEWWLFVDHRGKRTAKKLGRIEKKEAEKLRRQTEQRLAAVDLGIVPREPEPAPEPTTPTLTVFAAAYLKRAEHTLKYSTWKDYGGNLDKHVLPALGDRPLDEITRREVKALAFTLRDGGLKPKTVRKVIGTLSTILGEALDDRLIAANPAGGLKKVYRSDKFKGGAEDDEINPLAAEELAHLLSTAETHAITRKDETVHPYRPHHLFLLLLARTGIRLGEALALRWGDIDLHGGFLDVRRGIVRGRVTTPKNHKRRRVDLSDQLRTALSEARQERFGKVVALSPTLQAERDAAADVAGAWLFPDATGEPMDADNFRSRVWEPLLTDAKLRHVRIHDLRHTYASLLLQAGVELLYVSQQLGHHSPGFTLSQYGHLLPKDRRGEVNRLDQAATVRNPSATSDSETADPESETARNPLELRAV